MGGFRGLSADPVAAVDDTPLAITPYASISEIGGEK